MIQTLKHIDRKFLELSWDTFFRSRGRHLPSSFYVPWLTNDFTKKEIYSLVVADDLHVQAGLFILVKELNVNEEKIRVGLIGHVCVQESQRGKGIANNLLTEAVHCSQLNNMDFLTLWTGQHKVYEKNGFFISDRLQTLWITASSVKNQNPICFKIDRDFRYTSVPGYATDCQKLSFNGGTISIITDPILDTVVDWSGEVDSVGDFMKQFFSTNYKLCLSTDDVLLQYLQKTSVVERSEKLNQQMWRVVNSKFTSAPMQLIDKINFGILDRI